MKERGRKQEGKIIKLLLFSFFILCGSVPVHVHACTSFFFLTLDLYALSCSRLLFFHFFLFIFAHRFCFYHREHDSCLRVITTMTRAVPPHRISSSRWRKEKTRFVREFVSSRTPKNQRPGKPVVKPWEEREREEGFRATVE